MVERDVRMNADLLVRRYLAWLIDGVIAIAVAMPVVGLVVPSSEEGQGLAAVFVVSLVLRTLFRTALPSGRDPGMALTSITFTSVLGTLGRVR